MNESKLKINAQSIRTELKKYENRPCDCLLEYIWNSFDAGATEVKLEFDLPQSGFGYVNNVSLIDNGSGWDFDDDATTNNFLSSTKKPSQNISLPKGKYGRGRYTFIWIANELIAYSKGKQLTLQHSTEIKKEDSDYNQSGTKICFKGINSDFSGILSSPTLHINLLLEFGWLLLENEQYRISINDEELDVNELIKESRIYQKDAFPAKIGNELDDEFWARIVLWKEKPSEYSKYYFLNKSKIEICKQNTGLNKKSDDFWHSVYIKSSLFKSAEDVIDDENETAQTNLLLGDERARRIKNQAIAFLKSELINIRKPYLKTQSDQLLLELKEDQLIPDLPAFGIYDEESYGDLIKTIYTITPSLFVGKSNLEKKFVCATFAGLLSTQDDILIKTILEQLQALSEDEKNDLIGILKRTSLSNVIKTLKEIDHRLEVIDKIKILISEHEKDALEVKHIQKILDENFWLFGEQFRLFSSTEGSLKKVLIDYAKEVLEIDDPELVGSPSGEVDLFLTKTESIGEVKQENVIIELKRASVKLGKKEYDQIEGYMEKIVTQTLCNGESQYWEFYLIGKDYDDHIKNKIDSATNHGQKDKGLCYCIKDGRVKIFVRKWSDILEVEWGTKMKYLKEKLQIGAQQRKSSPQEITDALTSKKVNA